ncbi:MAG: hypothetical protein LBQ59_00610 [Candidatus Peribacteria bacterium]|jgi:hypothetical protein|nr:hypothetical protein [Candidatus Peribacteria bacterium]
MKIIITKKLKKELEKFSKYFELQKFINDLKEQSKSFLHIHDNFFKFKSNLNSIKFRGIVVLIREKEIIIPLFIALKKDKLY